MNDTVRMLFSVYVKTCNAVNVIEYDQGQSNLEVENLYRSIS